MSDQASIRYLYFSYEKLIIFSFVVFLKNDFLVWEKMKKLTKLSTFHVKHRHLPHGLKGTVVNQTYHCVNGGSFKMTRTVNLRPEFKEKLVYTHPRRKRIEIQNLY